MTSSLDSTDHLLTELFEWGATTPADLLTRYPETLLLDAQLKNLVVKYTYPDLEVLALGWRALQHFGLTGHTDKPPAESTVINSLMVRMLARIYRQDGYEVTLHTGYAKRGRDDMLLVQRDGWQYLVIGRHRLTMKALRLIVNFFSDQGTTFIGVHLFVGDQPLEPVLESTRLIRGKPLAITKVAREQLLHLLHA